MGTGDMGTDGQGDMGTWGQGDVGMVALGWGRGDRNGGHGVGGDTMG